MKYVIIDANSTMIPHVGVMLDEAISAQKEGHEIVYITCGSYLDACSGSMAIRKTLKSADLKSVTPRSCACSV